MTYLSLLLLGLLPPIAVLARRAARHDSAPQTSTTHQLTAMVVLVALAVLTTVPWDAALIAHGTWSYPRGQVVGWVAGIPVEELLFIVGQPLLTGLWLRTLRPDRPVPPPARLTCTARTAGAAGCLLVAGAGALAARTPALSYLGLLLAWAGPLLAVQWALGGDLLWARRRILAAGVVAPTGYLWGLDWIGLHLHLWQLSAGRTTGLQLAGLPVEEALFFTLTDLLVIGGLLVATDPQALARLHLHLHQRGSPGRRRSTSLDGSSQPAQSTGATGAARRRSWSSGTHKLARARRGPGAARTSSTLCASGQVAGLGGLTRLRGDDLQFPINVRRKLR